MADKLGANIPFTYKLGKSPRKYNAKTLMLSKYIDPKLPIPPIGGTGWENKPAPDTIGMFGNDTIGNCLIEGTEVSSPSEIRRGYKSPYSGPVICLTTTSGKKLTVTPNHAVLTPSGFACANTLKQGDYLVGTCGAQILPGTPPGSTELHFNQSPTKIEDIFSTLAVRNNSVRKVMPIPVHFHGDGKFINGDINIVGTDSFLWSKFDSLLGQPKSQNKVSTTGELQSVLHGFRTALHRFFAGWTPSFGLISSSGHSFPFTFTHSGISQSNGLEHISRNITSSTDSSFHLPAVNAVTGSNFLHGFPGNILRHGFTKVRATPITHNESQPDRLQTRPELYASNTHPSTQSFRTDPELAGELQQRFPGIVEFDCITKIERKEFSGHIYDLSTKSQWYVANGIVTHNCTCAEVAHHLMCITANAGKMIVPTISEVITMYSAISGYVPGDPSTDNGAAITDALNYWQTVGLAGHKILGWAMLDPKNMVHRQQAVWLFGGVSLGVELPYSAEDQFNAGEEWTVLAQDGGIAGGHCVYQSDYSAADETVATWGKGNQKATLAWDNLYTDECYVVLTSDWIERANGLAPSGFNYANLMLDLKSISG